MNESQHHVMRYHFNGSKGNGVYCSCGMYKLHNRGKVLVKWVQKHNNNTGHKWKGTS